MLLYLLNSSQRLLPYVMSNWTWRNHFSRRFALRVAMSPMGVCHGLAPVFISLKTLFANLTTRHLRLWNGS